MPVYDHSYQTWTGERRGPLFRWLAIPKFTYMEFFKVKLFVGLLSVAFLQFFLRIGYLYLLVNTEMLKALNFPTSNLPAVDAFFFKNMIDMQLPFCFIFAFILGAGLISKDLRHSALVLYFSKPISRWEYFLGKFFSIFSLFMILTWGQTTILFLIQAIVAPANSPWSLYFWKEYAWIFWAILLYSMIVSGTIALMILAASSLTKNSRYAGTTFVVYIIGSGIVAAFLQDILRSQAFSAISPMRSGIDLGYYLFNLGDANRRAQMVGFPAAIISIAATWALCGAIIKFRLDRVARFGR